MKRDLRLLLRSPGRDAGAMALRPLLIGGMVTQVEGGDGAVNIDILGDNPSGVLSAVDPYQPMQAGDHLGIYWDQTLVAEYDITDDDLNQRVFLYLSTTPIKPDWAEKVFYSLTRKGAVTAEESVPLRIRVKLDRPGGADKDPHLPGHSELAAPLLPQDVIDNGIDADWAAKGVPVLIAAYPGRAARDTIELKWGATYLTHRVTPDEASGSEPIELLIDQATILAGGDSTHLLVHYQVFDEVGNYSTDWSLPAYVRVDAGAHRLDAPIFKDANNDVIDLEQLEDRDAVVQIYVMGAPFALGDTVTLTWTGTPVTGAPLSRTQDITLNNIPAILEPRVANADIRAIRDGNAEASYVLNKLNDTPPQSSKRAFARISGRVPLPMPLVLETVGNLLDPDLERAHVEIPVYPVMDSGDLIVVLWVGTLQNGSPYTHEAEHIVTGNEVDKPVQIPVPSQHIAPLNNGTLDVSYRVASDALAPMDIRVSEHLKLLVASPYAELPAPSVDEAQDNQLDPETVPYHATLRVPYTATVTGDILTWYWQAETPDGSASDWIPITSPIAGKPVTFNIHASLIEPSIDSLVRITYSLKLASTGQYRYSHVLELTIGKILGELPAPVVLEANAGQLDPMQAVDGATVRVKYDGMAVQDVITMSWKGSVGSGSPADQQRPGNQSGQVDFSVAAAVVGANIDLEVSIQYGVKRNSTQKDSEPLPLTVLPFSDPDKQLPQPRIPQADSATGILNLATFSGDATLTVGKWPFSAQGQRVWLRLTGETENGGPHSIVLLENASLTAAQASAGLSERLSRTELEKFGQDSELSVLCNVVFDGSSSESNAVPFPRTDYTVKQHHDWVTPVIISVRDSRGEVENGSSTIDTAVTLAGKATASQQVQIFDDATAKGTAAVNTSEDWSLNINALALGVHTLKAKALYGEGTESNIRSFTVRSPIPDFVLDTSPVHLNGGLYGLAGYPGHTPLNWPANTVYQRMPSSGVAPYTYTSSDPSRALVQGDGWIISVANGTSTITVRDAAGRSASYNVTVSNVVMVYGLGNNTFIAAKKIAQSHGLNIPSLDLLRGIHAMYGVNFPMGNNTYWSSTPAPGLWLNYVKNLVTGSEAKATIKYEFFGAYGNIVAI
ncbi:Ig-like domain-containing protein [Pseudomonas cichorii]|uniref:Ig-like domain-containing protein n=1 Tax=Pseudomonas cichorii TaxID=36746 RepID=A0A3M4M7K4_PSECI|nr:Ig-like domain repeat protein [Pseudomonas cichorii]RMQ49539.1 Ig-like domain-containing protein [Pseudomonas cichorii]